VPFAPSCLNSAHTTESFRAQPGSKHARLQLRADKNLICDTIEDIACRSSFTFRVIPLFCCDDFCSPLDRGALMFHQSRFNDDTHLIMHQLIKKVTHASMPNAVHSVFWYLPRRLLGATGTTTIKPDNDAAAIKPGSDDANRIGQSTGRVGQFSSAKSATKNNSSGP
jgi:hypothetical protein